MRSKYGNKKVWKDGYRFDSIKEANYYTELCLRKKAGDIIDFQVKPVFELQPRYKHGGKTIRAITYEADFTVFHEGCTEIIDTKGFRTQVFNIKWKILKYRYGRTGEYKFTIV